MSERVKIELHDSAHRVALELALEIAQAEKAHDLAAEADTNPRVYFLNLYAQCRSVVLGGYNAEDAMKGK